MPRPVPKPLNRDAATDRVTIPALAAPSELGTWSAWTKLAAHVIAGLPASMERSGANPFLG